jgi:hypothetical protein
MVVWNLLNQGAQKKGSECLSGEAIGENFQHNMMWYSKATGINSRVWVRRGPGLVLVGKYANMELVAPKKTKKGPRIELCTSRQIEDSTCPTPVCSVIPFQSISKHTPFSEISGKKQFATRMFQLTRQQPTVTNDWVPECGYRILQ